MVVYRGMELRYGCELTRLPPSLAERFVSLSLDDATRTWIDAMLGRPHGPLATFLHGLAGQLVSDYDANGWLGTHTMRLLGTSQWRRLLGAGTGGRLLDVGAGDGAVTAEIAPLFDEVVTTELSGPMARRLTRRGVRCHRIDLATDDLPEPGPFDVVSLLDVLDRTSRPHTLLARTAALVAPGGRLVAAVPLPLSPHVHVGPHTVDPDEPLPDARGAFEVAAAILAARLFARHGLDVIALSRAPYLCRGDTHAPLYVLDDAVFVCALRDEES